MKGWGIAALLAAGLAGLLFYEPASDRLSHLVRNEGAYLSALTAAIALGVAMVALSIAAWAIRKAYGLRSEIAQLSRSLDGALHEIDARSNRQARTVGEINEALKADIARLTEAPETQTAERGDAAGATASGMGENVIPHPSVRNAPAEAMVAIAGGQSNEPEPNMHEMERAILRVSGPDGPELSLQPIVSVTDSVAIGFEVFAHVRLSDDRFADLQRLASTAGEIDVAGFERGVILAAAKAARQQLGDDADKMPLHCAISNGLLDDAEEMAAVAELFDVHPALTRSLVLSVPAGLLDPGRSGRLAMLETLSEVGIRFAVEDWNGTASQAKALRNAGVLYIKQPAVRLLGQQRVRGQVVSAEALVEAATEAGLQLIATDVSTDEQAIGLVDGGLDLLTGHRFGDPRRLRNADRNGTDNVVRI